MSKYYDELIALAEKNEDKINQMITSNYIKAIADMKSKLRDYLATNQELSYSKQMQFKRVESLIDYLNKRLKDLGNETYKNIKYYDIETFNNEYFGIFYEIEGLVDIEIPFNMINDDYIQAAIEAPVGGLKLSKRLYSENLDKMRTHVKDSVTQGLIKNLSYKDIAIAISDAGQTSLKHSLLIAVTEANRIKSIARQKGQEEAVSKGVKLEKRWLSTLDKKTRHSHQKLDGQTVPIDGEFEINDHTAPQPRLFGIPSEDIRCRCDTVTIVNDIAPQLRRDNETGEIFNYQNYNEWYEARVKND